MQVNIKDIVGNVITNAVGNIGKAEVELVEDDFIDIIINDKLELHIKRNNAGYSIDAYKCCSEEELEDEDHDFDEDFIDSLTIYNDQLETTDEE